jgi:hypothetical protein
MASRTRMSTCGIFKLTHYPNSSSTTFLFRRFARFQTSPKSLPDVHDLEERLCELIASRATVPLVGTQHRRDLQCSRSTVLRF